MSSLLHQAKTTGEIHGVAISRHAPRISHLLFADDTLIFCQASEDAMLSIRNILEKLESASGLRINLDKSAVVFSKDVSHSVKANLAAILGVTIEEKHTKYLGLPTVVGRSKREVFEGIKDRIWSKMQGWASKKLSQAGQAMLIKSILQALPTFVMSCSRLPDNLLREIEGMFANFLGVLVRVLRSTGLHGARCVRRKHKEAWALEV
ncbi:UNVERIFIED_CONTAM: hypothetical protein Slati_4435600 [Sesamum latifolium]|uniref:Reverse transcriptase domain-containing protein n=1 Tax=Sesamum latifolium TaxID=2727402 RepID=A0AAW2SQI3_9LAMI